MQTKPTYAATKTAREMAFTPHSLSRRARNAVTADGLVWTWMDRLQLWVR